MCLRRFGAFLFLLAAAAGSLEGQEDLAEWTIGVSIMQDFRLSDPGSSRAGVLGQLPLLVIERVRDLDIRFVPAEESRRREERSRLKELYAAGSASAALRDRRDSAALSPYGFQERAAAERKSSEQIARTAAVPAKPSVGEPARNIRTIRLWPGHASGRLVEVKEDPARACASEKLDYLILWEVREVSGFLRIRMDGWNEVLGRSDYTYTAYCPADDPSSAVEVLAQAMILAATARPSARLIFDVEPAEARVQVDGRTLAAGRRSLRVYEERNYSIAVLEEGVPREVYVVRSEFGKDVRVSVRLALPLTAVSAVESIPGGASLYLDGIWEGRTPAEAKVFKTARVALLRLPGFEDEFVVIEPSLPGPVLVSLREIETGPIARFDSQKDRFYGALGRLVLSLPVSILAYGVYLQSAALHQEYPGNESFSRRNDISLAVFVVSSGVTAGFLLSAAARLASYIQSAR